jgi:hypothetical protein
VPANLDADLFALLDRWREVREAWDATDVPLGEAQDRARADYPPMPDTLWSGSRDLHIHLSAEAAGRGVLPSGRVESYFLPGDVEKLRAGPPVTRWAMVADDVDPPPREPDPEGEARRQEIIATHDRWRAERKAVEDAVGYTAAVEQAEALAEAWDAVDDTLRLHQPRTVAGLARKAAWVADCLSREIGHDDLAAGFARQVAAFGGVAS